MSETRNTPNSEPGDRNRVRQLASTLLHNSPTQVGAMVTTVAMVGQASAQFHQVVAPYAAFLFSCLLAIYQVWLVQKATVRECLVMVPIAALILFALALATNNSIAPTPGNALLKKELEHVKEQLQLRNKEFDNAKELINEFRRNLGLPPSQSHSRKGTSFQSRDELRGSNEAKIMPDLFGSLIGQAHAQPSDSETERKRKLIEALREYETRRQEVEREQQRLKEEEKRLREEQQKPQ